MLLHNVEFDLKLTRGTDYKRYAHGRKTALVAINALDKEDEDYITKLCEIMDDFFADLLGEDYADRLELDTDDLDPMLSLLYEIADTVKLAAPKPVTIPELPEPAAVPEASSLAVAPAPANRAARRAARRAAKRHA